MNYKNSSVDASIAFCKAFDTLDDIHALSKRMIRISISAKQKEVAKQMQKLTHKLSQNLVDYRVHSYIEKPVAEKG